MAVCSGDGQFERIEVLGFAAPFLRHLGADMFPKVSEHGHLAAGDVVGHRHARQLDDAAFDGVHQREVAHGPGEERAFAIARAAEEERRGGEIDNAGNAELALDDLQAGDPEARGFVVLLGFFLVVALQVVFVRFAGFSR